MLTYHLITLTALAA